MPITVTWENDQKTTAKMCFDGPWTWDEIGAALGQVADLTQSVTHRVDLIVDTRNGVQLKDQGGLMKLRQIVADRRRPANGGLTVVVGSNLYFQRLMQALLRVYGRVTQKVPFAFTETVEDAQVIIAKNRPKQSA